MFPMFPYFRRTFSCTTRHRLVFKFFFENSSEYMETLETSLESVVSKPLSIGLEMETKWKQVSEMETNCLPCPHPTYEAAAQWTQMSHSEHRNHSSYK